MEELFDQLADALNMVRVCAADQAQFNANDFAFILAAGKTDEAASSARAIVDQLILEARGVRK